MTYCFQLNYLITFVFFFVGKDGKLDMLEETLRRLLSFLKTNNFGKVG